MRCCGKALREQIRDGNMLHTMVVNKRSPAIRLGFLDFTPAYLFPAAFSPSAA